MICCTSLHISLSTLCSKTEEFFTPLCKGNGVTMCNKSTNTAGINCCPLTCGIRKTKLGNNRCPRQSVFLCGGLHSGEGATSDAASSSIDTKVIKLGHMTGTGSKESVVWRKLPLAKCFAWYFTFYSKPGNAPVVLDSTLIHDKQSEGGISFHFVYMRGEKSLL